MPKISRRVGKINYNMSILTSIGQGDKYFEKLFEKIIKSPASYEGDLSNHLKGDMYFEFDNDDEKSYAAKGKWFKSGEIGVLDFSDIKDADVSINRDIKILNIGENCVVNLPNTFVNVANHITVIDYNSGLTEEEMKRYVSLADCVIMYVDHKKLEIDIEVAQCNIGEILPNVPVYFVDETFMEEHEQRRKDDHIVIDNILNPDWLAFYSRWSDDACDTPQPHICICPKRMDMAISTMNRVLGKQVQMKKFMYAIVLIHEFAHAVMDKSNPQLRYFEEAYFIEEPLANVVALKYTEAFKQAERCPEDVHLSDIAKLFIERQIYPYNAAPVFLNADIYKWIELK